MKTKERRRDIDLRVDPGLAGPIPGIYTDEEDYFADIAAGFPKRNAIIEKERQKETEAKKQAS